MRRWLAATGALNGAAIAVLLAVLAFFPRDPSDGEGHGPDVGAEWFSALAQQQEKFWEGFWVWPLAGAASGLLLVLVIHPLVRGR